MTGKLHNVGNMNGFKRNDWAVLIDRHRHTLERDSSQHWASMIDMESASAQIYCVLYLC
jgi:hypothetical protein